MSESVLGQVSAVNLCFAKRKTWQRLSHAIYSVKESKRSRAWNMTNKFFGFLLAANKFVGWGRCAMGTRWVCDGPPMCFIDFTSAVKIQARLLCALRRIYGRSGPSIQLTHKRGKKMKSVVFISSTMMKNIFTLYDGRSRYLALYKEN